MSRPNAMPPLSRIPTAFFVFSLALLLYVLTLAPTIGWGDSADLALRMKADVEGIYYGRSRSYLLYRTVGHLFQTIPLGDIGWRTNLMAAFFGAGSVALVYVISLRLALGKAAALAAAISLAVGHSFWFMSVTAEVYTFNIFIILMALWMYLDWLENRSPVFFLLLMVFVGLAASHHVTGWFLSGCFLLAVLIDRKRPSLLLLILGLMLLWLGSVFYWLRLRDALDLGIPVPRAYGFSQYKNQFHSYSLWKSVLDFLIQFLYNFPLAAFFIGIFGVFSSYAGGQLRRLAPLVLFSFIIIAGGISSSIPDKFNVYVLVWPLFSLFVGIGFFYAMEKFSRVKAYRQTLLSLLLAGPILVYGSCVLASHALGIDLTGARTAPYRDNATYFLWPPKNGDYGPRIYAEKALAAATQGSVILADYTLWRPLRYKQIVEEERKDVEILLVENVIEEGGVVGYLDSLSGKKTVYLATNTPKSYYQLDRVLEKYRLAQNGDLYEILPK
ncbi:MAG: hypothetical protein RLZZ627_658 [Pseudomonadota bacterium]